MKKITVLLLSIILIASTIPLTTYADGTETVAAVNLTHTHTTNNVADNQTSKTGCYQTAYTVTIHTHSTGCYHYHSGSDSTSPNGCYTKAYTSSSTATCSHTKYKPDRDGWQVQGSTCPWCRGNTGWCNVQWTTIAKNGTVANCGLCYSDGEDVSQCVNCGRLYCTSANLGASKIDGSTDTTYYHTVTVNTTRYTLGCGKSQGQLICTQPTTATRYKCAIAQGSKVGTYSLVKNKSNGYTLSAVSSGVTNVAYSWNTGATSSSIPVTANGTYSCTLTWRDSSGVNRTSTLSYVVEDYLQLNDVTPSTTAPTNQDVMLLCSGVGIAEYSLDNVNYIGTNTLTVTENGTYTVYVRNGTAIDSKEITITNIDKEPPVITGLNNLTPLWQSEKVLVQMEGSDNLQIDSYDINGVNYAYTDGINEITENGLYEYILYDIAGNNSDPIQILVTNIDKSVPELSYTAVTDGQLYNGGWAVKDIAVSVFNAIEHISGKTIDWYCNGTKIDGDSFYKTLDHGGLYICKVTTGAGISRNISFNALIDKKAPIIDAINAESKAPINRNFYLNLEAYDPED